MLDNMAQQALAWSPLNDKKSSSSWAKVSVSSHEAGGEQTAVDDVPSITKLIFSHHLSSSEKIL